MPGLIDIQRGQHICTLSLNNPTKLNALSMEMLRLLVQSLEDLEVDPLVRVIILRGGGEKAFSSGFDLAEVQSLTMAKHTNLAEIEASRVDGLFQIATEKLARHRCPIIAMIHGPAIGAACDLAAACDLRIADEAAIFATPAVTHGAVFPPESIGRLVGLVGKSKAAELLLTGTIISAHQAKEIGLINRLVPASDLEKTAYDLAEAIARNAPLSIEATKKLISALAQDNEVLQSGADPHLRELTEACFGSADFLEGLDAFLKKREPNFRGE